MISVGSGFGLSGGPITTTGSLAVDTSEIVTIGTSQTISGAKQFSGAASVLAEVYVDNASATTSTVRLVPYVLEISAPTYALSTKPIPAAIMTEYCADIDGCEVVIGMKNWSSTTQTAAASRALHLFVSGNVWRSSNDTEGVDGNGAIEHVINIWDTCYLTDGAYSSGSGNDSATGFGLLLWNGYTGPTRRCTLILRD